MPSRIIKRTSEGIRRRNAQNLARHHKNKSASFAKLGNICARQDCAETENLQLDHINPEEKTDHRIWTWSQTRRDAEIAKCQLLCYYHHVEKTINENYGTVPNWANYR